ncbi:MAG: UbiD family decarboxylase, partial [Dehalococcoidia bacterium]|nr:UbiD family decarboxylase [Dehalococcoidia bacterium]
MSWRDLRAFLRDLEERGELLRVQDEVDPKLEVGAYTLAAYCDGKGWQGPVLYFEKVKGHEIPVVTNLFGTYSRYARAFDLEERTLFDGLLQRYERLVEPVKVPWGPCKERILTGESLDLGQLPIAWWNEHDAGPYITAGCVITKDLETGRHNVGRYRLQLKGRDRLGILVSERQHIGRHYDIARDNGQPTMDVAVAIGSSPVLELASVASIPYEWEEYAWAAGNGGSGEPIELVKGETVDLWVPATAEVVIEGNIRLGELEPEGPLGEFTGYYSGAYANPVIQVTAITHRQTPIMVGIHMANG